MNLLNVAVTNVSFFCVVYLNTISLNIVKVAIILNVNTGIENIKECKKSRHAHYLRSGLLYITVVTISLTISLSDST